MNDTVQAAGRGWRQIERYVYVERLYDDVWPFVAGHLATLGDPLPDGGRSVELKIHTVGREVSRAVRLHVGGFVCHEDWSRASLDWTDAAHPRAFPHLEAALEIRAVPTDRTAFTQLGVVARYRPPLGPLGALGDRLVGADVVDASITAFLDELADSVGEFVKAAMPDEGDGPAVAGRAGPRTADPGVRRLLLPVDGLAVRPGGAAGPYAALAAVPGVVHVSIDPGTGLAAVDHDPTACRADQLSGALACDAVASDWRPR